MATRRTRRAADRRVGRRALDRRARRLTIRLLVLADEGYSPSTIANSTGLKPETVAGVLALRVPQEGEKEEAS